MFRGLDIIKATINNYDITEKIKYYYGVNNDWQNKVWKKTEEKNEKLKKAANCSKSTKV